MSQARRRSNSKSGSNRNGASNGNKRNARKHAYETSVPGWVWLFTGVVLGAFVMFLFYLKDIPPQPTAIAAEPEKKSPQNTSPNENSTDNKTTKDGDPAPRFVFYELLKENEVIVETDPSVSQQAAIKALENVEYIIQAGSFRNHDDAERLRAKLLLQNLPAKIDTKTIGESTWHRILVGPFKNRPMTAKARGTLASMNIDTLVIKRDLTKAE